jgi:hypothetical protein
MKRCAWKFTGVLVASLGVVFPPALVEAGPSTSPSARQAARLKHNPPRGWIRHYLPDDRYKILGGTWKYVSTELDRFYYPAWAPEMLRRPAGRVIGFASAQDAEEAGYMPASGYAGVSPGFDRNTALSNTVTVTSQSAAVRSGARRRVTLADGRSTVLVPPNWQHTRLATPALATGGQAAVNARYDLFTSGNPRQGGSLAMIISMNAPSFRGRDLGAMLRDPNSMREIIAHLSRSNPNDAQLQSALANMRTRPATVGNLRGVELLNALPANLAARMPANVRLRWLMAGRGSNGWAVIQGYNRTPAPGLSTLVGSARFR